jgi:hypothetical protein
MKRRYAILSSATCLIAVPLLNSNPPALSRLPPGVYKTVPYSCIVIVPGSEVDPGGVIKRAMPNPTMPILKPDLQFVPRSRR